MSAYSERNPNNPRKKPPSGKRHDLAFTNLQPAFRRMFDILSDKAPHLEVDVIASCAPLIAPTEAGRHMQNQLLAQGRNPEAFSRVEKQAQGQRRKVQQKLRALERNGHAERRDGWVALTESAVAAYQQWKADQH